MSLRSAALIAALSVAAPMADAGAILTPIHYDIAGRGYNLVARDTDTSLEWMSLPFANGPDLAGAIGQAARYTGPGWRLATRLEVCGLALPFSPMQAPCDPGLRVWGDADAFWTLLRLIGWTFDSPYGGYSASGRYDDDGAIKLAEISAQFESGSGGFRLDTAIQPDSAYFLVRSIPEPSAAALLGIGLTGLAAYRSRLSRSST